MVWLGVLLERSTCLQYCSCFLVAKGHLSFFVDTFKC